MDTYSTSTYNSTNDSAGDYDYEYYNYYDYYGSDISRAQFIFATTFTSKNYKGGVMGIRDSSFNISSSTFTNNSAGYGGVYCHNLFQC